MTTLIFTHPTCMAHDPGMGHPESPARLEAVLRGLERWEASGTRIPGIVSWVEAPLAPHDALLLVHDAEQVERVLQSVPKSGTAYLDPDTGLSPETGAAAMRAVGAITAAVDAVVGGDAQNAFAAVRPPGHHAEPNRSMGFCLFNNVAIAAAHARKNHGVERVAVVDFDVHHGNGTEAAFREDEDCFFASSHQFPNYPGTGSGGHDTVHIRNAPLAPGSGSTEFRDAWGRHLLPALEQFAPELILISAGFDAHRRDPLAQINLEEEDFAWVTEEICLVAEKCCAGRIVSTLEGGYDLDALAASAVAHVEVLARQ